MTAIMAPANPGRANLGQTRPEPSRRIGPLDGLRNTFTLTWRSVLKIRTNMEDVIGLSLQPIMFLVLFTYVFGGAIAHGSTHAYLQYALPGLLVMTVVFATLGTGLMLNQDISSGVFDRFRSLPIARWAPLGGAVLGDMVRYAISVAVTIGFGLILGFRVTTNPVSALAGCLLLLTFAVALCWVSALIGMLVKTPQGVQAFGFMAFFPLVFGSNLLVPTATMPGWLQAFVRVNPTTSLTDADRGLFTGGSTATPVLHSLLWALGIFIVFAPSRSASTAGRPSRTQVSPAGPGLAKDRGRGPRGRRPRPKRGRARRRG